MCVLLGRSISHSCGTAYASVYLLWDSVGFYLPSNVQAAAGPVQSLCVCVHSWFLLLSVVVELGWRWRCCWLCRLLWWAAVCGAAGAGGGGCGGAVAGSWEARCRHLRWPMARVAKALTTANSLWLPQLPPADCYPTLYTVLSNLLFFFWIFQLTICICYDFCTGLLHTGTQTTHHHSLREALSALFSQFLTFLLRISHSFYSNTFLYFTLMIFFTILRVSSVLVGVYFRPPSGVANCFKSSSSC